MKEVDGRRLLDLLDLLDLVTGGRLDLHGAEASGKEDHEEEERDKQKLEDVRGPAVGKGVGGSSVTTAHSIIRVLGEGDGRVAGVDGDEGLVVDETEDRGDLAVVGDRDVQDLSGSVAVDLGDSLSEVLGINDGDPVVVGLASNKDVLVDGEDGGDLGDGEEGLGKVRDAVEIGGDEGRGGLGKGSLERGELLVGGGKGKGISAELVGTKHDEDLRLHGGVDKGRKLELLHGGLSGSEAEEGSKVQVIQTVEELGLALESIEVGPGNDGNGSSVGGSVGGQDDGDGDAGEHQTEQLVHFFCVCVLWFVLLFTRCFFVCVLLFCVGRWLCGPSGRETVRK